MSQRFFVAPLLRMTFLLGNSCHSERPPGAKNLSPCGASYPSVLAAAKA